MKYDYETIRFCEITNKVWNSEAEPSKEEWEFWLSRKTHSNWIEGYGSELLAKTPEWYKDAKECYFDMFGRGMELVSC